MARFLDYTPGMVFTYGLLEAAAFSPHPHLVDLFKVAPEHRAAAEKLLAKSLNNVRRRPATR